MLRCSHLASENGYGNRRFQAVAILLRTPRTGILSEEAIEQAPLGEASSIRPGDLSSELQIVQLMQYLRYAGLRNASLGRKRGYARFLVFAVAEPHESANDCETRPSHVAMTFAWAGDE